jgi:hypothetical protein
MISIQSYLENIGKTLLLGRSLVARNQERVACAPLVLPIVWLGLASIRHSRWDSTAATREDYNGLNFFTQD